MTKEELKQINAAKDSYYIKNIPENVRGNFKRKPYEKISRCDGCFGAANGDCVMCRQIGRDREG